MTRNITPDEAARIQALFDEHPLTIPAGEAKELPPEVGWPQWDMAVRLQDTTNFGDGL